MKFADLRLSLVALAFVFLSCTNHQIQQSPRQPSSLQNCTAPGTQVVAWNFDWDDNIAYTTTKIVLYKNQKKFPSCTRAPIKNPIEADLYKVGKDCFELVSTEDFTEVRLQVGVDGTDWVDFEVDPDRSFWYFRDQDGVNWFAHHIEEMVRTLPPKKWKGPSWNAFQQALSDRESTQWTSVITARGHSKGSLYEGLEFLQSKKYVQNIPPIENLHAVSHPDYAGTAASPSAAKVVVMTNILDCMNQRPFEAKAKVIVDPDKKKNRPLHLWGFSDDDWGNYQKAVDILTKDVASGRWPNVKITLFYTGRLKHNDDGKIKPQETKVIMSDGTLRDQLPSEKEEVNQILRQRNKDL
jgi:hypothetical protein